MDDRADAAGSRPTDAEPGLVPGLAFAWLRSVIEDSPAAPPAVVPGATAADQPGAGVTSRVDASPSAPARRDPFGLAARYARGEVAPALWYRDWHVRWRRFQLPDRLHSFETALLAARAPEDVYRALTEHAVQIVGGYTCLLFPPQESGPLRPLPNAALRIDADRITLSLPLAEVGLIGRERVLEDSTGRFAALAPLFSEERAVSLAHAPFGEGGVILLVERRHERLFDAEDWDLLRLLSTRATAALMRVRLGLRVGELQNTDAATALPDPSRLDAIIAHARDLIASGESLSLVGLRLDGLDRLGELDGAAAAARARRTAADVLREVAGTLGLTAHRGDDEFVLLLPRLSRARAEHMVDRLARQLPAAVRVRARLAAPAPGSQPADLLADLDRAPERAWSEPAPAGRE
jgi:GGDEF domain-containing protein